MVGLTQNQKLVTSDQGLPKPRKMRPSMTDLIDLTYALSALFGIDTDLNLGEAANLLNLVTKVSINSDGRSNNSPKSFLREWNGCRRLFTGPKASVPLEESIYKPWTDEKGHPLRGVTGLTWGDCTVHMRDTLERCGIAYDPAMFSSPDHLAIILEFVGFLLESGRPEEAVAFSSDHLDWLESLLTRTQDLKLSEVVQTPINAVIQLRELIISLN